MITRETDRLHHVCQLDSQLQKIVVQLLTAADDRKHICILKTARTVEIRLR